MAWPPPPPQHDITAVGVTMCRHSVVAHVMDIIGTGEPTTLPDQTFGQAPAALPGSPSSLTAEFPPPRAVECKGYMAAGGRGEQGQQHVPESEVTGLPAAKCASRLPCLPLRDAAVTRRILASTAHKKRGEAQRREQGKQRNRGGMRGGATQCRAAHPLCFAAQLRCVLLCVLR